MESPAVLRSFPYTLGTASQARSTVESICMVPLCNVGWPSLSKSSHLRSTFGKNLVSSPMRQGGVQVLCVKTSENTMVSNSEEFLNGAPPSERETQRSVGKNYCATFPNGFEALIMEVCDETEIAELKMKVGNFEMHVKRNIAAAKAALPVVSPTSPPPIPSKPMIESAPVLPPSPPPPKSTTEKVSPFTNVSGEKSTQLSALGASGASGYVLLSSPTVGSFRRGRTLKGKKLPPACKEGDVIKEGQVIGFLDQFGTELPVKSDVSGEVLKVLFNDGEAVGYGDPLIAVLPSFHGIE